MRTPAGILGSRLASCLLSFLLCLFWLISENQDPLLEAAASSEEEGEQVPAEDGTGMVTPWGMGSPDFPVSLEHLQIARRPQAHLKDGYAEWVAATSAILEAQELPECTTPGPLVPCCASMRECRSNIEPVFERAEVCKRGVGGGVGMCRVWLGMIGVCVCVCVCVCV
jgi:hypothetical protein